MPPSPPPGPLSDKGKGKATSGSQSGQENATSSAAPTTTSTSSTLTSMLASAARAAPSDIASLLSSQGKPPGGLAGSSASTSLTRASARHDDVVGDLQAGAAGSLGARQRGAGGGFRSAAAETSSGRASEGVNSMNTFAAGPASSAAISSSSTPLHVPLSSLSLDGGSAEMRQDDPTMNAALVGSYSSSDHLVEPMHRVVRQNSLSYLERERTSVEQGLMRARFNEAWDAGRGASSSGPASSSVFNAQGTDFMALLDADEKEEEQKEKTARTSSSQAAKTTPSLPRGVTHGWTPPSPTNATISLEQLEMHRRLGALQDGLAEPSSSTAAPSTSLSAGPTQIPAQLGSAYQPTSSDVRILSLPADLAQNALGSRASEGIRPPDDDRERGEGVYAMDPVRALQGVLGGGGDVGGDMARETAEAERRGRESANRVRQTLGVSLARGSYVDDVYGLPPLLSALLADAEAPSVPTETQPDPDMEARREKAIRRLDALWKHLGGGGGAVTGPDAAEAFLKGGGGM